ncbi:tyrosine-type recombinase/integrase [Candidatus Woesebacteria bacterium]|nr:tyrosine-type recombinase/integrase [Candidatus Woesebacteria bacterium]
MQTSLKDSIPTFIKNLEEKGRSPSTILAYRADLEQLADFLSKKNIAYATEVKSEELDAFRDALLAEKYTPKSVSRKLNAVKTFFRFLMDKGDIQLDPSEKVAHPKVEPTMPKFLSPLEYRALRDIARDDKRIAAIVEMILQTGMRISEVANLKLENIRDNKVIVEAYATQPQRTVPINKRASEALSGYLKERPQTSSPFVFTSKNGKPLAVRNIRAAIDRYMQRAEISGYSVNDLRTTFIVENLKQQVDIVLLSQIVGHKRFSTTERYLDLAQVREPGKKQALAEL